MTGMQVALLDTDEYVFSEEERQLVVEVVSGAEGQVRGLLRGLPERLNVAVYPTDLVIPDVGDGGVTPDKDLIELSVDPGHPGGVVSVVRGSFRTTLFHAAHHAATAHLVTAKDETLLGYAVQEGLATAFERDFAGPRPLYAAYDPAEAERWLEELMTTAEGRYEDWFYSRSAGCRRIGYRVGTYIVDTATANSQESAASLVGASTAEVLEMAHVDGPSNPSSA